LHDIIPSYVEQRIWSLRYDSNWPLRRIAASMHMSITNVHRKLKRYGRPAIRQPRDKRMPQRTVRPVSLSTVYNA